MRKRSCIVFGLLLLAVIGGIAWLTLRPNEPMYKGKRLSVWLEGYDDNFTSTVHDMVSQHAASEAVRHIGTNAIPTLLRKLRAKDSPLRMRLVALAQRQHIFEVKYTPAYMLMYEGRSGFAALGAMGRDAVPELIRMYEANRSSVSQNDFAQALGSIGPAAEQAVPALVRSLADGNLYTRISAIGALQQIHAHAEIAVPALVKCFSDNKSTVRMLAAQAIQAFNSDARQAVPDLLLLLADSDVNVRNSAKEAIKRIDPEAAAKAGVK